MTGHCWLTVVIRARYTPLSLHPHADQWLSHLLQFGVANTFLFFKYKRNNEQKHKYKWIHYIDRKWIRLILRYWDINLQAPGNNIKINLQMKRSGTNIFYQMSVLVMSNILMQNMILWKIGSRRMVTVVLRLDVLGQRKEVRMRVFTYSDIKTEMPISYCNCARGAAEGPIKFIKRGGAEETRR